MPATMLSILDKVFLTERLVPMLFMVAATGFLLMSVRRKLRKQQEQAHRDPPLRDPLALSDPKEPLRRDLETLLGELQDLSRRVSAEIDTRFLKLEAAIHDADRRIAALARLAQPTPNLKGDPATAAPAGDARHAVVYELADAGASPVDIARQLGKTPGEVELILRLRGQTHATSPGPASPAPSDSGKI